MAMRTPENNLLALQESEAATAVVHMAAVAGRMLYGNCQAAVAAEVDVVADGADQQLLFVPGVQRVRLSGYRAADPFRSATCRFMYAPGYGGDYYYEERGEDNGQYYGLYRHLEQPGERLQLVSERNDMANADRKVTMRRPVKLVPMIATIAERTRQLASARPAAVPVPRMPAQQAEGYEFFAPRQPALNLLGRLTIIAADAVRQPAAGHTVYANFRLDVDSVQKAAHRAAAVGSVSLNSFHQASGHGVGYSFEVCPTDDPATVRCEATLLELQNGEPIVELAIHQHGEDLVLSRLIDARRQSLQLANASLRMVVDLARQVARVANGQLPECR